MPDMVVAVPLVTLVISETPMTARALSRVMATSTCAPVTLPVGVVTEYRYPTSGFLADIPPLRRVLF